MISINLYLQIRITGRVPSILLYIHTQKFLGHSCLLLQNTVFQLIPSVLLTDILHYSIILLFYYSYPVWHAQSVKGVFPV